LVSHAFTCVSTRKTASLALQRHLSVFIPSRRQLPSAPVDSETVRLAPRVSFRALQHSSDIEALLCTPLSRCVWKGLPASPKVPFSGFGYPLNGVSSPYPWTSLSTPDALGLCPSELCSASVIRGPFRIARSAPALSYKTNPALYRRFSGLLPQKKPCLFSLPGGLDQGEACCSLELLVSRALSSFHRSKTRLSSPMPLTSFPVVLPYGTQRPGPQGTPIERLSVSHYRALARLTFRPTALATS
jgi:hypothetical protein